MRLSGCFYLIAATGSNQVVRGPVPAHRQHRHWVVTLASNITGNNNTAIGAFADVSAGNLTNATAIDFQASQCQ